MSEVASEGQGEAKGQGQGVVSEVASEDEDDIMNESLKMNAMCLLWKCLECVVKVKVKVHMMSLKMKVMNEVVVLKITLGMTGMKVVMCMMVKDMLQRILDPICSIMVQRLFGKLRA